MVANPWVDWPLVGREPELREFAHRVVHANGSLVLAGPAGVGKTRLAAELCDRCVRAGLAAVTVTGTSSSADIPFGAFAPLLPPLDRELIGRVDARADLLRRTAATLVEEAAPRRLVLVIDDAHVLDGASATLAYQMATTTAASVVATFRTGEASPPPITGLWKDNVAVRHDVAGLTTHGVGELLSAVLSGPVDPTVVGDLLTRSDGNVLFLRELVIGALDSGALRNDGGLWRLRGQLAISHRLIELVSSRLGALTPDELALLELVAVGEPIGVNELTALGDTAVAEVLERKQLLVSTTEGQHLAIRFTHPIYSEVIRNQTPALRRQSLARALAIAVEQAESTRRDDLLRVAVWRLEGGGGTAEQMLAAAAEARWRYDFSLAERLVRIAQATGAGPRADLLAAQLASLQGRGEVAESEFASLAEVADVDALRGAVAISRIDNLAFYLGRTDEGIMVAREAEAALTDRGWRDQIKARRSALVLSTNGPRAAAQVAAPLLQEAKGEALVWAAQVAAFSLGRLGRIADGLEATARGHAAHLMVEKPLDWYPWTHEFFRCQLLAWSGQFHDARALASAHYERALTERSGEAQAWFAWQRASMVGEQGNVVSSVRNGREAVALFRELGRPQFMAFALTYLALALALGGQGQEATSALRTLDELGMSDVCMGVDPHQARAWAAVALSDLPRARRLFREAASTATEIGDVVGHVAALHGLARLGHAREVHADIRRVAERIEGDLVRVRVAHVGALVRDDAGRLSDVADAFESMGADLLAAESAADAAVALRKSGDHRRITAAERRAQLLAERCEGAGTPALTRVATPVSLSPAERDAALLAAAGRSNKDIARELQLSVRTVEGRLQRAYARLGVGSRRELSAALESKDGG